ncbi:MAG: sensor domain-containing diguanylate cyclase [Sulfuricella denitrificans]|nr:sensor domain-containing diguanylate cyclase [Sulfuricella denitrificans]
MKMLSERSRLLGWLSVILVVGFLTTSIAGYVVSRNSIRAGIATQALPLTADNIYSEIQRDILHPVVISSLMSQDTFLREWILDGERDPSQIVRYLNEIKKKYGTVSSFLVSERSLNYYYAGGTLKTVRSDEPRDEWYFRVRDMKTPYETNVDYDMANRNTMTVFINYRVLDFQGNFIGATGVGLTLDAVSSLIDSYQEKFHRRIYFVDPQGTIVLAGKSMKDVHGSIRDLPGIGTVAGQILSHGKEPSSLEYHRSGNMVLVNSRFIPELGWHLVVEQNEREDIQAIKQVFWINLTVSSAVSLLVLAITLFAVNRYQRRLESLATTDALTGLLNRQAFETSFQNMIAEAKRTGRPFSAILLDIDLFKQINDNFGHLEGDKVLHSIAQLVSASTRESDVAARWGGEEFLVMLRDCPLEEAINVAEKLRQEVSSHRFPLKRPHEPITVSLGIAQYIPPESDADFFARIDNAMYQAKENGRNLAVASRTQSSTPASNEA